MARLGAGVFFKQNEGKLKIIVLCIAKYLG
jgi:hypothetical protein